MKCSKIQQLLSNYVDGSVSKDEKRTIEDHLKTCTSCQNELEMLQKLGQALDTEGRVPVSNNFKNLVLNRIKKSRIPLRFRRPFFLRPPKWAYPVGMTVILLITILCGNYMGKTFYKEYAKKHQNPKPTIEKSVYQFGVCCELPDSSFSVKYLNVKM